MVTGFHSLTNSRSSDATIRYHDERGCGLELSGWLSGMQGQRARRGARPQRNLRFVTAVTRALE